MACESQQSRNTGTSPSLPAKVPTTQGEWGQVREAFNQLAQQVRQARSGIGVNIMPYSYATFDGEALPTLSVSNATASLDTGAAIFGNGSLKLAVSGDPAIAYFGASSTDYKHSISPNSKWLLSAFVKASGASQDLKLGIKTSNGTYSVAVITDENTDTVTRVKGVVNLIDDDAQKCVPFVQVDESSGNVWFDGLMIEAIAEDTAYPSQFNYTMPPRDTLVGSLVMEGQSHIRLGQTAFDTGTGFWQGDDSGTPKMSMGDSSNGWKWDGTTFTIRGTSVAGSYVITTGGNIRQGQTDYDTGTGFWLGDDGGTPKLSVGDSSGKKITWDGSDFTLAGGIVVADSIADGVITKAKFVTDTSPVEKVTALPSLPDSGYPEGMVVYLTTDNKLYRSTGSAWTKAADGGDLTAGSVTADKITVTDLAAINADMGSITAGDITLPSGGFIQSGMTDWNTGTGFWLGSDGGTPKFSIGDSGGLLKEDGDYILLESGDLLLKEDVNKFYWDGTDLQVFGTIGGTFEGNVTGTIDSTVEIDDDSLSENVPLVETGSFTGTLTGFSSNPSGVVYYYKVGNLVTLYLRSSISGTSNSDDMDMEGLPASLTPSSAGVADTNPFVTCPVTDSGNFFTGAAKIASVSTIGFYIVDATIGRLESGASGNGFTASGTKGLPNGWAITYVLE